MVWDPQKPKISLLDPPVDPHFGTFCVQKGRFWGQKHVFSKKILLQIIFYRFPDGLGPSKTQNWPFIAPNGPHLHLGPFLWAFWANLGSKKLWDPQKPKIDPLDQWTPFGRAPALPVTTQPAWSRP